jgi:hypothetical protein
MQQNKAVVHFLEKKLVEFNEWYADIIIQYLVHSGKRKQLICRYVLYGYKPTETFADQYSRLNIFKNGLKVPACFICIEPCGFEISHFVFEAIVDKNLLLVNPIGISHHSGFYEEIATLGPTRRS